MVLQSPGLVVCGFGVSGLSFTGLELGFRLGFLSVREGRLFQAEDLRFRVLGPGLVRVVEVWGLLRYRATKTQCRS